MFQFVPVEDLKNSLMCPFSHKTLEIPPDQLF